MLIFLSFKPAFYSIEISIHFPLKQFLYSKGKFQNIFTEGKSQPYDNIAIFHLIRECELVVNGWEKCSCRSEIKGIQ